MVSWMWIRTDYELTSFYTCKTEVKLDVNSVVSPYRGFTPLHCACTFNQLAIVKLLITECEAKVNVRDFEGWTPLHTAAAEGFEDIVRLLCSVQKRPREILAAGELSAQDAPIDLRPKNLDGETPEDLAKEITPDEGERDGGKACRDLIEGEFWRFVWLRAGELIFVSIAYIQKYGHHPAPESLPHDDLAYYEDSDAESVPGEIDAAKEEEPKSSTTNEPETQSSPVEEPLSPVAQYVECGTDVGPPAIDSEISMASNVEPAGLSPVIEDLARSGSTEKFTDTARSSESELFQTPAETPTFEFPKTGFPTGTGASQETVASPIEEKKQHAAMDEKKQLEALSAFSIVSDASQGMKTSVLSLARALLFLRTLVPRYSRCTDRTSRNRRSGSPSDAGRN